MTSAAIRKSGTHAVDGSFCPLPLVGWVMALPIAFEVAACGNLNCSGKI